MAVCTTCLQPGITNPHDCPGIGDIQLTRQRGRGVIVDTAPSRARMALTVLADATESVTVTGYHKDQINIADQVLYQVVGYAPEPACLVLELIEDWRPRARSQDEVDGKLAILNAMDEEQPETRLAHLQATSEAAGNLLTRTTDERDQLRAAVAAVRQLHQPTGVVAAAEYGNPPDCAVCGPNRWPCPTYNAVTDLEQTPAKEQSDA